jgi:hypothetical protein
MSKKNGQNPGPKSFANVVGQAGGSSTPSRTIELREDGGLILKYPNPRFDLTLSGVEPEAVAIVEAYFLEEDERAWLRIVDAMDLALLNPGITNNAHAADFCSIVRQLALSARGSSTIDQVLAPLKKAAKSMHASDAASKKNEQARAWVAQQWRDRSDLAQSKAAFANDIAPMVRKKFSNGLTADTIARYWLPKGKPSR